jgi:hypothetical protein
MEMKPQRLDLYVKGTFAASDRFSTNPTILKKTALLGSGDPLLEHLAKQSRKPGLHTTGQTQSGSGKVKCRVTW